MDDFTTLLPMGANRPKTPKNVVIASEDTSMKYEVVERVAWYKYAVKDEKHGVQHWQRMDVEIRKDQVCVNCKRQFAAGTTRMYRPVLDLSNRRDRLCAQCVEGVKE